MPPDPASMFGHLLSSCIRDEYTEQDRRTILESAAFLALGAASSLVTTYVLSLAGILV